MATNTSSKRRDEEDLALGVGRYYESERNDLWGRAERNASTGGMSSLVDPTIKRQVDGLDTTTDTSSGLTTGGSSDSGGAGGTNYGYSPTYDNEVLSEFQSNPFALSPAASSLSGMATGMGLGFAGFPSIAGTIGSKVVSGLTSEEGINENTFANAGLDMLLSAVLGPVAGVVKGVGKLTGLYDTNLADIIGRASNTTSIMSNSAINSGLISTALDRGMTDTLAAVNNPNFTRADRIAYLQDLNAGTANVGYDEAGMQALVDSLTDTPEPVETDSQNITDTQLQAGNGGVGYDEAGLQSLVDSIMSGEYQGSNTSNDTESESSSSNPSSSYGGW